MYQPAHIVLLLFPALVLFGVLLPSYFLLKRHANTYRSLVMKGLCTLVPIILCFNGCLTMGFAGFWWILAGLLCYLLGDLTIDKNIWVGMGSFVLGHGAFIGAFLFMATPSKEFIPIFFSLLVILIFVMRKPLKGSGFRYIPYFGYAVVLLCMTSLALTLPFSPGTGLMAGSAVLFTLSDVMLAQNTLSKNDVPRWRDIVSLGSYYAALYLMALSVWM
jgi:uncharacterized membrane protein YhhN